ncbi:MAG: glycosyltransferase family 2 protein [Candidatus Dormibacteraeota bacterium]|uniref:Glycosyltransferase family 2 protein n=1 Tax=Candidatus Aeolococcus gillhamiae TaxID=3127015 RepID=A0A934JV51_9BACT|nr:glycosyltransferase family 2 protein [Candidatus Dormibacteraeota bacterium]
MSKAPRISAVIPCRDEALRIEACVRSVLAQEDVSDLEVIVLDGLSTDGTSAILDRLRAEDSRLRVIPNPLVTTPAAMNLGIKAATGTYVAIMGAHNRYAPDYLARCLEIAQATKADNVGGVVIAEPDTYIERAIAAAHHSPLSAGGSRWHSVSYEGLTPSVWGGFYLRRMFEEIGGFDEALIRNQDDELNLRLIDAGGTIWQSPRIRSWYRPRSSLVGLFRQYLQYGYWKVHVIRKHRAISSPRHIIPPLFVVSLSIASLVSGWRMLEAGRHGTAAAHPWLRATMPLTIIGIPYTAVTGIASIGTARTYGWDLFPILPATFTCFHIGYGAGFVMGVGNVLMRRPTPNAMSRLTR